MPVKVPAPPSAAQAPASKAASPFSALIGELSDALSDAGFSQTPKIKVPSKALAPVFHPLPVKDTKASAAPPASVPATQPVTKAPAPQVPARAVPAAEASTDAAQEQAVTEDLASDPIVTAQVTSPAANAVPIETKPTRGRSSATTAASSTSAKLKGAIQVPFFLAQVPVTITPPPPPKTPALIGSGSQEQALAASRTEAPTPPERTSINEAALEVRIKDAREETNQTPQAVTAEPAPAVSVVPEVVKTLPELPPAPQITAAAAVLTSNSAPPIVAEVPLRPAETAPHPALQTAAPSSARSTDIEEPVTSQIPQQPVRSVSLEFSPDGAGDVRLRLSEKAGEVHISLHSSDVSLTSRLHEGVHDLVGSLSSAGYEAEAWTPGQGQQGNQREPEQRRSRPASSNGSGDENFGDMFQQPIQEIS